MTTWHQTIIIGNLGRDPELRYLQSGTAVCNLNVAVSESWSDRQSGERREKTTWYRVAVWGAQAENCNQYLSKGQPGAGGRAPSARAATPTTPVRRRPASSMRARDVRFMSSRQDDGGAGGAGGGQQAPRQRGGGGGDERNDDFAPPPSDVGEIPF